MSAPRPRIRGQIAIAVILFAAFALRLLGLDAVRTYHDMGEPHSLGIGIVESIQRGAWGELPSLSLLSGIRIPNPVGASYVWALVAVFDRSPFVATALSVMLNVLAVAMLYDLARKLFGRTVALAAAALMAVSLWSIFMARGAWIQGQLEFGAICCAWLVLPALRTRAPRRLFAGFVVAALMAQTYLAAFALTAQVSVALLLAIAMSPAARSRAMRRAAVPGALLCAISIAFYGVILLKQQPSALQDVRGGLNKSADEPQSIPNPFGWNLDTVGLRNTLQVSSGGDFERSLWADFAAPSTIPFDPWNSARAKIVEVLLGIGALFAARRALAGPVDSRLIHRQMLVWFGLPMSAAFVVTLFAPHFDASRQYMLLTQPMGYLLAALPFGALRPGRLRNTVLAAFALTVLAISAHSMRAYLADVFAHPFLLGNIDFAPLRIQGRMGALWRAQCAELAQPQRELQVASVYQSRRNIRHNASQDSALGTVWAVRSEGGTCVAKAAGGAPLPFADVFVLPAGGEAAIDVYRSLPVTDLAQFAARSIPGFKPLTVNLGWTLVGFSAPGQARAGAMIQAMHVWRIDSLPAEPHDDWFYPVFAHLARLPGQERRAVLENGPTIPGAVWRVGDYVISTVNIRIPADAEPGDHVLEFSLFDPNQKKNAVYFDPADPATPILFLKRSLLITH